MSFSYVIISLQQKIAKNKGGEMKKIFTTSLIVGVISISSFAFDSVYLNMGLGSTTEESSTVFETNLKGFWNIYDNLLIGIGGAVEFNGGADSGEIGYELSLFPEIRYDITDKLSVFTNIGYSYGDFGKYRFFINNDIYEVDFDYDGLTYGGGFNYQITDNGMTIGAQYRYTDCNLKDYDVSIDHKRWFLTIGKRF